MGLGQPGAIKKLCDILGLYVPPKFKNRLINDLDIKKTVIFIGPYEHHSNDLIWRECCAEVVEIAPRKDGSIDLLELAKTLSSPKYKNHVKIGAFSAASNITGIKSPVYEIARTLHKNNALACFDFAASGPYVDINMNYDEHSYFDAIYFSPHKFIGGPGSSGILIINKKLYDNNYPPTLAGGGTVKYVNSSVYDFIDDVESREKAGTPGILQTIKAYLVIELKNFVGVNEIERIEKKFLRKVFIRFLSNPNIIILGPKDYKLRVGIFSFNIKHKNGLLHHRLVAKLLNDLFGIQSRAGCMCAGPYGHRLLNIDKNKSLKLRKVVNEGINSLKPGWVRVNFHYAMRDEDVDYICNAIEFIGKYGYLFISHYNLDIRSGLWVHKDFIENNDFINQFGMTTCIKYITENVFYNNIIERRLEYKKYIAKALEVSEEIKSSYVEKYSQFGNKEHEELRWFYFSGFLKSKFENKYRQRYYRRYQMYRRNIY